MVILIQRCIQRNYLGAEQTRQNPFLVNTYPPNKLTACNLIIVVCYLIKRLELSRNLRTIADF